MINLYKWDGRVHGGFYEWGAISYSEIFIG